MAAKPSPPRPDLERPPQGSFGWLPARLRHEHWLPRLGPQARDVLLLLALAADRQGASFYSRARMAQRLGLTLAQVDQGLRRLLALELVAFRPWTCGAHDGVWQLLPLPAAPPTTPPASSPASGQRTLAQLLAELGFKHRGVLPRPDSRRS